MLAADMPSPWQNPIMAADVNFDQRVSALDALIVINALLEHGVHSLDMQAAPLTATGASTPRRFVDTNGDNRVSAVDALIVINELNDTEMMLVRTFPTDLMGNPISSIAAGSSFLLVTEVQDIRDPEPASSGVFAAAADIAYSSVLSSIDTGQSVQFGDFFPLLQDSTLTQGQIIASASTDSSSAPGNDPQFLFSVELTATNAGMQIFTPRYSNDPSHEYLVFLNNNNLTEDEVQFVGSTLDVLAMASLSVGNVSQAETDADTTFNFVVELSAAQQEEVTVAFTTDPDTATEGVDYQPTSGTLTFAPGTTLATIPVTVNGDTDVEPDEQFSIILSNASSNAEIGTPLGIGTILNDDALATLTIAGDVVDNVPTGTTTAFFTVSLSADPSSPVTVAYATSDITAVAGVDYEAASGTLTFNPGGGLTQSVPVTIIGDPNVDDVDTFLVSLSDPSENAEIGNPGQDTIQINPAVSAPGFSITAEVSNPEGDSGTTDFVFELTLDSPSGQEVVLAFQTEDGTADSSDYNPISGTITFSPGQTSAMITVEALGDTAAEPSEDFLVNVTSVSGATGEAVGRGVIVDDDGPATITISDATVSAGSGPTEAVFTVTLSGSIDEQISVAFATSDDTAVAPFDYQNVSGNLVFTPGGPVTQEIRVIVNGSSMPQPDQTFFVNLSSPNPPSVIIADNRGIGTIITQGLLVSDGMVVEGNSGTTDMVFTVALSRMLTNQVTVAYSTQDISATAGSDYVATSGVLTFAPGIQEQTFTVPVIGDTAPEANERFRVILSNAVGAPIFSAQSIGTILNDDGDSVLYRIELADPDTGDALPINATLDVDDEFLLRVYVTDVQQEPVGVLQAFLDVTYEASLVEPTGDVDFSDFYDTLTFGTFESGRLNDFGGFGEFGSPPVDPGAELLFFTVPFKAIDVGLVNFVASVDPADLDPGSETFLYFSDDPVPADDINLENRSINIGANVFVVTDQSATEGNSMFFTVTRFLPNNEVATVEYTTADGTATAGLDYQPTSGTLTFMPGSNTQTIEVIINDDNIDEPNEDFLLFLDNPFNATASELPATGTIIDNDGEPTVSVAGDSGSEGTNLVFTVSLSAASGKQVTVAYNTANGVGSNAAVAGSDYQAVSGTLTFEPGVTQQTVTVAALTDVVIEPNETFRLILSNPQNAGLGTSPATGTIVDVPPAGISGFVYVDVNNNGNKDANEIGLAGATVTVVGNGITRTTTTAADGSYTFLGLPPGSYTIIETQPGFYVDGRDTRFGIDSATNDRFTNVVLAPSAAETGYNFGERGVRADFIGTFTSRKALLASAANGGVFGASMDLLTSPINLQTGDAWISFDNGWSGLRAIEAFFDDAGGHAELRLYNNNWQEIAVSAPTDTGAVLFHNGQTGTPIFLRIRGTHPSVTASISEPGLPAAVPLALAAPGEGEGDADDAPVVEAVPFAETAAASGDSTSPQTMVADEADPLVSSDGSDEVMAEEGDWLLEALLS